MIHSEIDSLSSFVGWNLFLCLACFLVQPALARWDENVAEGNKIEWTGFFFFFSQSLFRETTDAD